MGTAFSLNRKAVVGEVGVRSRASLELGCDVEQVQVQNMGEGRFGAYGCGRWALYDVKTGLERVDFALVARDTPVAPEGPGRAPVALGREAGSP